MNIKIVEDKLVLSEAPVRDIPNALIVVGKDDSFKFVDVKRLEKEYYLPDGNSSKDISSVYLRVL